MDSIEKTKEVRILYGKCYEEISDHFNGFMSSFPEVNITKLFVNEIDGCIAYHIFYYVKE